MKSLSITEVRKNIYQLIDQTNETHEPIQITGKRNNAILVSEKDWRSIQETLCLTSIPKMKDSIIKGLNTPLNEISEELTW